MVGKVARCKCKKDNCYFFSQRPRIEWKIDNKHALPDFSKTEIGYTKPKSALYIYMIELENQQHLFP